MKLEELLGEELYKQVAAKIDEKNAGEPDKLKHIRYADLSEGEYVGRGKYDSEIEKLNNIISGKDTELTTANDLIAETKIKAAIKVALLSEKAVDVDYLTYKLNEKLKEKGETLELDENDNIKGWNEKLSGLKTQFPKMFESASGGEDGFNRLDDGRLPDDNGGRDGAEPKNLAEALQQKYEKTHNE